MENSNAVLLGDKGYPLRSWLNTPYRAPRTPVQEHFNEIHKLQRVTVERVIGQAKRKFPILKDTNRIKTEVIPKLIVAAFILHNMSKRLGQASEPDDDVDENVEGDEIEDNDERDEPGAVDGQQRNTLALDTY